MRYFGTFDALTDEEDTIYSRLAVIRRELERLDLEQNEAQQDIKMWHNKILDDKFKVKFWLVAALILSIGALPWHLIILYAVPPGFDFVYAKIFSIIATFLYLVESFIFLPLTLLCVLVCLFWIIKHLLRNGKAYRLRETAGLLGIKNRNMLIEEQRMIVGSTAREIEVLKEEEERLKVQLDCIQKEKK